MAEIASGTNGSNDSNSSLVLRAMYSYADDGDFWAIAVETEGGIVRTTAGRLADVERRAYEAVRTETGLEPGAFDVEFMHHLDMSER